MKRSYLLLVMPLLITACKPKPATTASKTDSVAYPYTIKHPDQWVMDTSKTNTMSALNILKAVEKNDTSEIRKYLANSIEVNYDKGKYKGPLKPFLVIMKNAGDSIKNTVIKMQDWEAVVSKVDSKDQWVTTWYKQIWTDMKGKTDSVDYIDDEQFKDGKIVKIDEYARHYPAPKK